MKHLYTLVFCALGLLTACSKDSVQDPADGGDTGETLQFVVEGLNLDNGITTYGQNDVVGIRNERKVEEITVYIFEEESSDGAADGVLRLVRTFDNLSAMSGTITLDMGRHPELTDRYVAYFVANNANDAFVDMSGASENVTTEEVFRNLPTVGCSDVSDELFLMSGRTATAFRAFGKHSVELRKRVARFDLVNKRHHTLTVKSLSVRDANDRGHAFANAAAPLAANRVHPAVVSSFTWEEYKENQVVTGEQHAGLFYLHPTTTASTKIYVECELNGDSYIFELSDESLEIKANYRYLLTIEEDNKLTLTVADWDEPEGGIHITPNNILQISQLSGLNVSYDKVANTFKCVLPNNQQIVACFITHHIDGLSWTVEPMATGSGFQTFDESKFSISQTVTPIVTYAQTYYYAKLNVLLEGPFLSEDSFVSKLTVKDEAAGQNATYIIYHDKENKYYPGTAHEPIAVGGITWAPVNVGACEPTESGLYFQWGRSFRLTESDKVLAGPMPFGALSSDGVFNDVQYFVVNRQELSVSNGDWIPSNDSYTSYRNALWKTAGRPCPEGWRVPTAAECDALVSATHTINSGVMEIDGDAAGTKLLLPLSGTRDRFTGTVTAKGNIGRYWSSDTDDNQSIALDCDGTTVQKQAFPRAEGMPLRCVKN